MLKNFDLRQKKVIDIDTAELVGFIRDMDIDFETGSIRSVTIPGKGVFGGLLGGSGVTVPWEDVIAIGSEYVLIKMNKKT